MIVGKTNLGIKRLHAFSGNGVRLNRLLQIVFPFLSPISPPPSRTCILVLGMHRSGTSAITGVLRLLGVQMPKSLMDANQFNETGFWESQELFLMNDRLLAELGSSWTDWKAIDFGGLVPERREFYKSEIKRIILSEFGDAKLFAIKDPRICRFVALYEEILFELGIGVRFILPYRNPFAVIESLGTVHGISVGLANLLWLRHVIDAEAATRGKKRAFISYDELLENSRQSVARLGRNLRLKWPNKSNDAASEIASYLRKGLQHHEPTEGESFTNPDIGAWSQIVYSGLKKLEVTSIRKWLILRQFSMIGMGINSITSDRGAPGNLGDDLQRQLGRATITELDRL